MYRLLITLLIMMLPTYSMAAEDTSSGQTADATQTQSDTAQNSRPTIKAPKPEEYYINSDFDRYFQADEVKKLLAGDSDFYALFRDDMTGRPRGVALLLPDWGLHAANNQGIDSLRTTLPDFGWVTLSMSVPRNRSQIHIQNKAESTTLGSQNNNDTNPTDAPADGSTTDTPAKKLRVDMVGPYVKPKETRIIDEDHMSRYQLQIKLRLQALITEAENYQGYFIIIAQGSSAAAVASLYAEEEQDLPEPEALVFINAFLPDRALSKKMNQDISLTPIPTLDIYPSINRYGLTDNVKIRRKLVMKNFKTSYRQQMIFGDISYYNQNRRILKSVYGWLSSIGL